MSVKVELNAESIEELTELARQLHVKLSNVSGRSAISRKLAGDRFRKRTDEEVLHMVRRAAEIGVTAAAQEAGVSPSWLSRVRAGHIWKHLGVA